MRWSCWLADTLPSVPLPKAPIPGTTPPARASVSPGSVHRQAKPSDLSMMSRAPAQEDCREEEVFHHAVQAIHQRRRWAAARWAPWR